MIVTPLLVSHEKPVLLRTSLAFVGGSLQHHREEAINCIKLTGAAPRVGEIRHAVRKIPHLSVRQ